MRTKHFTSIFVMLTAIVLLGASCGQKASVTTDNQVAPVTKSSDACGNPYYPFKLGLAIAYGVTPSTGAEGDSDYTLRIVNVSGTKATTRAELASGATADLEADCASGSVALKGSAGLGAELQDVKFKTTVVDSSGTYMPTNVTAGSTWNNSETIKMELAGESTANMGPITVTTTEKSRALGEESVQVPAGTYTAMKVEVTRTTTSKLSSVPGGLKLPEMPPTISTSTEWWVKGIGMVKTVTTTEGKTSTTEAKSVKGN